MLEKRAPGSVWQFGGSEQEPTIVDKVAGKLH